MGDSPGDRQALEKLWRSRLRDSRLRLDSASRYVSELQETYSVHSVDGSYAYRQALRAEGFALTQYGRVLMIVDGLMKGRIPDESEWPVTQHVGDNNAPVSYT